jgi:hypothetical protein
MLTLGVTSLGITSLFGLPAHVFLVHIPIILVPLVAIGAVLTLWPKLRARLGVTVVVLAFAALVATFLATETGKSMREFVTRTALVRAHTRIGENLRPWAFLVFVALFALVAWDWWTKRRAKPAADARHEAGSVIVGTRTLAPQLVQRVGVGLSIAAILFAGVSVYWLYRIGHTGARASWSVVQHRIDTGQRVGGDRGNGG